MDEFDYIIVGAGSSGCVLADRLSARGDRTVLLLEAGGTDRRPSIRVPIGYGTAFHDPRINWRLYARADAALNGRMDYWPRGKCLGGSSSINAMVYCRGLPHDFDDWEAAGNPGWGAAGAAEAFERIERREGPAAASGDGPLWVTDSSAHFHPLGRHFERAARQAGLPLGDVSREEGVGPYLTSTREGWRCSAADAFLRPAMRRSNLEVVTSAQVLRVEFEDRRATSLHYRRRGVVRQARCRAEIILAAGAVHSPVILQRSGIGPGAHLRELGLPVILANEAVGGGLQDHLGINYGFRCTQPSLNELLGSRRGQLCSALRYLFGRRGAFALSVNQMGGLVRSAARLPRADIQLYFNPLTYSTKWRDSRPLLKPDPWPGFTIGFNPCRPTSRGRIDLASPDPDAPPAIVTNALSTNKDISLMVTGARLVERLLRQPALRRITGEAIEFALEGARDEALVDDVRARAGTVFHPCGTCRMAPRDAGGVVDPAARVWGIDRLRVVDASIFPNITSANINAPTIMVAMRCADRILEA